MNSWKWISSFGLVTPPLKGLYLYPKKSSMSCTKPRESCKTTSSTLGLTLSEFDRQEGGGHYKKYAIQPLEFITANDLKWCEANAVKYIARHRDKNGKEDILKAIHYLQLLIEMEYSDSGT